MDPFGLRSSVKHIRAILKKEPFLAQHFRMLMEKPEIKGAKRVLSYVVINRLHSS
jgi:hypothetical protein